MKLLVVEDEQKLALYLQKGLGTAGFVVDIAHDGVTGLHMSLAFDYSAIILDSMLPGMDGLTLLAALRTKKQTPVLMLTALGKVEDRVTGLQTGADDYLVKPFAFSELIARIQGLLRRSAPHQVETQSNRLTLHNLEMDLVRRKASRNGQRVDLSAKEFLRFLCFRKQGSAVTNRDAEQVWDMNFDSNTNVVGSFDQATAVPDAPETQIPYAAWAMSSNCANETEHDHHAEQSPHTLARFAELGVLLVPRSLFSVKNTGHNSVLKSSRRQFGTCLKIVGTPATGSLDTTWMIF
jgi:DNA-binding response OmpR family regulator